MLCISDLHIGVQRSGGTTPQSQQALRGYLLDGLIKVISSEDTELTINGDLFDGFSVDTSDVIRTANALHNWLSYRPKGRINLIAGNHDWNPRGDKLSSFHLLVAILRLSGVSTRVNVFDRGYAQVSDSVWSIPHMPNQDLFNAEIEKAASASAEGRYLLLHCNYKNTFAEHSDHSLNISDEQVGALMVAGWTLIIGHEHIGYSLRGGRVLVVGNQFPSSVSDCLGNHTKHAVRITDEGLDMVPTWSRNGSYLEVDWRQIEGAGADFIRVTGEATSLEAAEVIKAISNYRQTSDAFVIANAVKVAGHDLSGEMAAESVESLKAFDVVGAIMAELTEQEQVVVKELMK